MSYHRDLSSLREAQSADRGILDENQRQVTLSEIAIDNMCAGNRPVSKMVLSELQPSQLFISEEKLARVLEDLDPETMELLEPIPIKKLGDETIYSDGHTRALAAYQHGLTEIPVVWDEDELDWEAYEICVNWCKAQGILTIADLAERIVDSETYERLWLKRCREMHSQLKAKR